jgi:hypothetical protein
MNLAVGETREAYGRPFRLLAGYALFLALCQVFSIALSLGRVRITQPRAILVLVFAAGSGALYARAIPGREPPPERTSRFTRRLAVAATAFACLLYLVSWISALAKPDFSWDGNSYHIPMISWWARRGFIHWIAFDHDVASGGSYPVNTCNLWFWPLGVSGVLALSRALSASRWAALATSVMFGLAPTMIGQGLTAYVDASLGYSIAALLGCLVEGLARFRSDRVPWHVAPAIGASVGLAAASKSSGLGPSLLAVGALFGAGAWLAWRAEKTARVAVAMRYARFLAFVAAVALVVTAYWYGRSWWYTGNPLSPVRVAVCGHELFPGVPMADAISEDALTDAVLKTRSRLGRLAFTWAQAWPGRYPDSIRYYDSHLGGLGFLWLLACLPAIGVVLVQAMHSPWRGESDGALPRAALFPIAFGIVFVAFSVTPMNWWARYTIWIYAAGLPALALVIDEIGGIGSKALRATARGWIALVYGIAAYEAVFAFCHSGLAPGFLDRSLDISYTPAGLWHALTYYDKPAYFYENMSPMDRLVLQSSETVGVGAMPIQAGPLVGQLSMPVGARDIVFVGDSIARDESRLRDLIEEKHIRWIFWRDDVYTPEPILRVARAADRTMGYWRTFDVGVPDPLASHDLRAK